MSERDHSSGDSQEGEERGPKSSPATPVKRKSGGSVSWGSGTPKARRGDVGLTPATSLPSQDDASTGWSPAEARCSFSHGASLASLSKIMPLQVGPLLKLRTPISMRLLAPLASLFPHEPSVHSQTRYDDAI